ncbi:hypothetical protein L6164_013260 [Bauhinia variegata]|uniref:Uncharacterized protein n=2 Tax=Bauhinia variegata TaxID=167791 RepID=A0ACB9PBK1_BAUVA|nr:hypothetical protein L6164_013254 [Bauhinia variegata]KAI4346188.1 hypothetical protein L6164_013260 [Bauhinia variegata]
MSGFCRNFRSRRFWDEDDDPIRYNASMGSFNNTGSGTQDISGLKNTGYKSGDGNGMYNQNHFGNVMNNNGFHNSGTQHIGGLINNTGNVNGNGNGSIVYGGFDSSTNYKMPWL